MLSNGQKARSVADAYALRLHKGVSQENTSLHVIYDVLDGLEQDLEVNDLGTVDVLISTPPNEDTLKQIEDCLGAVRLDKPDVPMWVYETNLRDKYGEKIRLYFRKE